MDTLRLLPAVLLVLVACASAPRAIPDAPSPHEQRGDPLAVFYAWGAFTVWSCQQPHPVIYVRAPVADTLDYRATVAHELSHAAMMTSFPSCEAFYKWREDPENNFILEALGFCAGLRQRLRDGQPIEPHLQEAVEHLATRYDDFDVTEERAEKRLKAVCR